MDGELIPSGLLMQEPVIRNFFENHLTVQFDHRMMAYFLTALIAWHIMRTVRADLPAPVKRSAVWLGAGLALQIVLGITALMLAVPMSLGAAHQLGAVLLLGLALWHLHLLRYN
jgi:cytochrome c oxidase assembly protein subunit 15